MSNSDRFKWHQAGGDKSDGFGLSPTAILIGRGLGSIQAETVQGCYRRSQFGIRPKRGGGSASPRTGQFRTWPRQGAVQIHHRPSLFRIRPSPTRFRHTAAEAFSDYSPNKADPKPPLPPLKATACTLGYCPGDLCTGRMTSWSRNRIRLTATGPVPAPQADPPPPAVPASSAGPATGTNHCLPSFSSTRLR